MDEQMTEPARRRTVRLAGGRPAPRAPLGRAVRTHLLIALAVGLAGAGVWLAAPGGAWGVVLALEVTALLLGGWALVLLGSTLTRRGRLVVDEAPGRVVVPGSRPLGALLVALLLLSLLLPATVLASWAAGEPLGGSVVALGAAVLLLPLGLPVLVRLLTGRVRLPSLVLDATGVTWHSWSSEQSIAWADLADVRLLADPGRRLVLRASALPTRRSPRRTPRTAAGDRTVGGPAVAPEEVSVPVGFLASDAALVADLVEACRTDASRRAALGTDAALHGLGTPG
ncbi:hypothetical protein QWY28_10175 [Nocardioides sp. SOB77]|uniref:PH domain-containing protein n=1 Tax=Nocardioides oceani TaxID=3058369 RepID=A0ABT8FFD4_9ACTN|nr:hypothetical protein [Nocardioides oceani]MDN4173309.1 hypothetical protein [Nocardioides oceani]